MDDWRFDSSEDEVALTAALTKGKGKAKAKPRSASTPTKKAAVTGKRTTPTKKTAEPGPGPAPPRPPKNGSMPEYSSWEVGTLQKEVGKFGFRVSKEKSVLVDQLTACWRAMHPDWRAKEVINEVQRAPRGMLDEDLDHMRPGGALPNPPTPPPKKKRAAPKKKAATPVAVVEGETALDVGGSEDTGETVGEMLRKAIVGDAELYARVLRYEPVHFDVFVALAVEKGIKCAKPLLMRCLDAQCITHYTQDPTNGSRSRYK